MEVVLALLVGGLLVAAFFVWQKLQRIGAAVEAAQAERIGVTEAAATLRERVAQLQAFIQTRQEQDREVAGSIKRLELVIAGTYAKGAAAENILEVAFNSLPVEWQARDFRVGSRVVEFGLRLPNGLVLPIDSKWPATSLLEMFVATEDLDAKKKLKGQIEQEVVRKAREVQKYLEPGTTLGFGVAVVPDAIYELCSAAHSEAFRLNVVLVSHSMFVPYLLLVFETVLKSSQSIDLDKLDAYLGDAQKLVQELQEELSGRYSRALTMMANSRESMAERTSRIGARLTSLRVPAGGLGLSQLGGPSAEPSEALLAAPASNVALVPPGHPADQSVGAEAGLEPESNSIRVRSVLRRRR